MNGNTTTTTYLVANTGGPVTVVRLMTKQNSIWSKALIMPLTIWNSVLSNKQNNYFNGKHLALLRNYFHNRFPSSNFLLPTVLTGGKMGFQVANWLLLISNLALSTVMVSFGRKNACILFEPVDSVHLNFTSKNIQNPLL